MNNIDNSLNTSGIYIIICIGNNASYVGQAGNLYERFRDHKSALRANRHCRFGKCYLQRSWNKYGEENFIFDVLAKVPLDQLNQEEQFWIDWLDPEMNVSKTAGSNRGVKHTKEALYNMSVAQKIRFQSQELRDKHKLINVGRKHTEEFRAKMREVLKKSGWQPPILSPEQMNTRIANMQVNRKKYLMNPVNQTSTCDQCNRMFAPLMSRQHFCNKQCKADYWNKIHNNKRTQQRKQEEVVRIISCSQCNISFTSKQPSCHLCSQPCKTKWYNDINNAKAKEDRKIELANSLKDCEQCESKFITKRTIDRFCSKDCYKAFWNKTKATKDKAKRLATKQNEVIQ